MPFAATWMDLEVIILSEVSQIDKDKYNITYMWNLKKIAKINLFIKQKQTKTQKTNLQLPKGKGKVEV